MSLFSFLFFVLSVVGERQQTRTRERELRERELRKTFRQPFWTLDIGEKNSKKKKGKKERERTCGARWLSCAFFENDVDTKKKKKTPYAVPRCLTFNRITTHTHTQHARTMFALQSQIAGAKVVSKVVAKKQQRSTVVSAKIAHGKGTL